MRIRTRACAGLLVLASVGVVVSPASADPKNGETVVVNCEGIGEVEVAGGTGRGQWGVGHDSNSSRVFVVYGIHAVITLMAIGGEPYVVEFEMSKNVPHNARTTDCHRHDEFEDPDGSRIEDVTYSVHYSPVH